MKLPADKLIIKKSYHGYSDENDLPHGYGRMEYFTSKGHQFTYEGMFVHGKRHGYGRWYSLCRVENPQQPWEWYQEGDYDSAGRLIAPKHKSGSYEKYINSWFEDYAGWWVNDNPKHEPMPETVDSEEFAITHDKDFLRHFLNQKEIRALSWSMVEKLRRSDDPYGKYGYAQWLYRTHLDKESLKTATNYFKYASENGVADALQMLSKMYYHGEAYDDEKDTLVFDRNLSSTLNELAIERGSELAKLIRNYNLFYGKGNLVSDRKAAIAEAEREAKSSDASIMWTEQLAWFYDDEGMRDKAIAAYEKCIDNNYYIPIANLAFLYEGQGKNEYYKMLMEEGIRQGVAECFVLGIEQQTSWDELNDEERNTIYINLKHNLRKGITMGDGFCAYALAFSLMCGEMGFTQDISKAIKVAREGVALRNTNCCMLLADIMTEPQFADCIPEGVQFSSEEALQMLLMALRYDYEDALDKVIENSELYAAMGYGDEIESVWRPVWEKAHLLSNGDAESCDEDETEYELDDVCEKSEIVPTVLVIHPSGFVDFVDADLSSMSFAQMAKLIDAEGLDAVHFSNALTSITKACSLDKQVVMYVDSNGVAKGLDDNPVATMLYGKAHEIRGAVIIAMEDDKYNSCSFDTEEDVENVFDEIYEFTGGLLRRDVGQEDGRYDPWV